MKNIGFGIYGYVIPFYLHRVFFSQQNEDWNSPTHFCIARFANGKKIPPFILFVFFIPRLWTSIPWKSVLHAFVMSGEETRRKRGKEDENFLKISSVTKIKGSILDAFYLSRRNWNTITGSVCSWGFTPHFCSLPPRILNFSDSFLLCTPLLAKCISRTEFTAEKLVVDRKKRNKTCTR